MIKEPIPKGGLFLQGLIPQTIHELIIKILEYFLL